jgi:hypothetical protein
MGLEQHASPAIAFPETITNPQPFFLDTRIPFPSSPDINNACARMRQELNNHWELAESDFIKIYQSEGHGQPIRELVAGIPQEITTTLEEVGNRVGVNKHEVLQKVRRALQIGKLESATDIGLWQFTDIEVVQYMVGLVGKRGRNIYARKMFQNEANIIESSAETL